MKKIVSILFCLASTLPLSSCQEDRFVLPAEKDEHGMSINPYLDNLWATVKANEAGLDTWNILQFLLEASDLGWDQKYIKLALTNLSNEQVRTEGDPYYGQNARYVAGTHTDRNNVQFSLQLATLLKMLYWDTLNEENKALLDEFIDYAVYACVDYKDIAVTYSNIYLMKTWNLIALGENLPTDRTWGKSKQKTPAELAEEGYQMFEAMVTAIREETVRRMFMFRLMPRQEVKRVKVAKEVQAVGSGDSIVKKQPVRTAATKGLNEE